MPKRQQIIILEGPQLLTNKLASVVPKNFLTIQDSTYDIEKDVRGRYRQIVEKMLLKLDNLTKILENDSTSSVLIPNLFDFHPCDPNSVTEFTKRHLCFLMSSFRKKHPHKDFHVVNLATDPNHHYELLIQYEMVYNSTVHDIVTIQQMNKSISTLNVPCRSDIVYTGSLLVRQLQYIFSQIILQQKEKELTRADG